MWETVRGAVRRSQIAPLNSIIIIIIIIIILFLTANPVASGACQLIIQPTGRSAAFAVVESDDPP